MILPAVPYSLPMFRQSATPVRVWYSLGRKQTLVLQESARKIGLATREDDANVDTIAAQVAELLAANVECIEAGSQSEVPTVDSLADWPLPALMEALIGVANGAYDQEFAKKS